MAKTDFETVTTTGEGPRVIPVIEETMEIRKRVIETGKVRITKTVTEREELVDEPLLRTEVEVRHVPVARFVETAPPVRHEGNVTIVSVMEEVLVVEKRLRVKEEIHITQRQTQFHDPQTVTLRTEAVSEEREGRGAEDR